VAVNIQLFWHSLRDKLHGSHEIAIDLSMKIKLDLEGGIADAWKWLLAR
jgi:hypothetical protein